METNPENIIPGSSIPDIPVDQAPLNEGINSGIPSDVQPTVLKEKKSSKFLLTFLLLLALVGIVSVSVWYFLFRFEKTDISNGVKEEKKNNEVVTDVVYKIPLNTYFFVRDVVGNDGNTKNKNNVGYFEIGKDPVLLEYRVAEITPSYGSRWVMFQEFEGQRRLMVLDKLDGSTRVINFSQPKDSLPISRFFKRSISPNGKYSLLFTEFIDVKTYESMDPVLLDYKLYLYDFEKSSLAVVYQKPGKSNFNACTLFSNNWSSDSKKVYFGSGDDCMYSVSEKSENIGLEGIYEYSLEKKEKLLIKSLKIGEEATYLPSKISFLIEKDYSDGFNNSPDDFKLLYFVNNDEKVLDSGTFGDIQSVSDLSPNETMFTYRTKSMKVGGIEKLLIMKLDGSIVDELEKYENYNFRYSYWISDSQIILEGVVIGDETISEKDFFQYDLITKKFVRLTSLKDISVNSL